ncbi:MAG: uncharacterized protein JWM74_1622 [Myxococcaceae bacterium]|nr:uncharacterized protein [Myxococcaceae bacterium]
MLSPEERRAQARTLFESGLGHFDRGEWSAALADFLRSREIFPTRSATKNAAVCLRKEARFDEALDMFEELLRAFTDLSAGDRAFAEREIAELRGAVGALDLTGAEPGAAIVVDGRTRGAYPTTGPIRVSAGTHVVRVFKEGFVPFERRVDVAGRQLLVVDAKLGALTQSGRLAVTEVSGRALDVVVDSVTVGKTPWEGTLAVGRHTVILRGEGDEGSPPVDASVLLRDVTRLSLAAEHLDASLRVVPTPAGAMISIDGVIVGQGVWEGRLRSGPHKVEVAADGFLPQAREARVARGERGVVPVSLERDPTSPLWRVRRPPRAFAEVDIGPAIGLVFGGDVRNACTGDCDAAVPIGLAVTVHGGYELSSGFAIGLDAGYLNLSAPTTKRSAQLLPKGLAPNGGTIDDLLVVRGLRIGPSAAYRMGDAIPITLRLGAGVFVGSGANGRTGPFTTAAGERYDVSVSESSRALYAYIAPEARVGVRIWSRLEASAGVALLMLAALDAPTWTDRQTVHAGPVGKQGDGVATFGSQSLAGSFLFAVAPTVGLHYAF